MKQFTPTQKEELKALAKDFRYSKITMQEYHNRLQQYYS